MQQDPRHQIQAVVNGRPVSDACEGRSAVVALAVAEEFGIGAKLGRRSHRVFAPQDPIPAALLMGTVSTFGPRLDETIAGANRRGQVNAAILPSRALPPVR